MAIVVYKHLGQLELYQGEYRQRQAAQSNTLEDFFTIVHNKFLGSAAHYTEVAREEFLLMKCCSFERKDLEKHFDRMSRRYYSFNGMDDVNAKHTFLNSTWPKGIMTRLCHD